MTGTDVITVEQVEDVLLHGNDLDVVSPDAIQDDMVRRILAAESLEQAFGTFESTPAADLEGQRIIVHGIAWMRSSFADGPKVYALIDAEVASSKERVTVSMGGRTLMASFLWAMRHHAMPFAGTFRKEQSNSNPERAFWTFAIAEAKYQPKRVSNAA